MTIDNSYTERSPELNNLIQLNMILLQMGHKEDRQDTAVDIEYAPRVKYTFSNNVSAWLPG